ncbi:hypothetical protein BU24DRAFT_425991 [Aaosphaeria arxii CBS 175.79]|uniref:Transcription initiation factor TFIID subunit 12 domain-containing protein n=1 Tax=Aaosphaeria arxii CBS 175.79 TaxID=1450172 RepID=A0A6A5XIL8_9PLEO|nr:uncharacterized protein BU24DRAFT_425991 [Aaosphaeria arxii CBS 175.79]KAF2012154.1 hypothetical protein BU24DRAFT_425991 [Aaosphaeria arxii CBS 175.79]
MSNPQAQGSQGPPQQAPQMLKAEDIVKLHSLNADQKQKYRPAMENFWNIYNTKAVGSPEHNQAKAKLAEWSSKLISQERAYRLKMKQQQAAQQQQQQQQQGQNQQTQQSPQPGNEQQQQQQAQQTPQPQPQAQQQQTQPQAQQQQQPTQQPQSAQATAQQQQQDGANQAAPSQPPQQGNAARPQAAQQNSNQPPPEIMKHVLSFPVRLPPDGGIQEGTPEGDAKVKELRSSYTLALMRQKKAQERLALFNNMMENREKAGQPLGPDVLNQKQVMLNEYSGAKKFVDDFRTKQAQWKAEHERRNSQAGGQAQHPQGQGAQPQQAQTQQSPQAAQQSQPQQAQGQVQGQGQQQQQSQPQQQPVVKQETQPQIKIEGGQQPQQFPNVPIGQQQNQQMPPGMQQPRPPPAVHSQSMPHPNQAQFGQNPQQQQQQMQRPQINPLAANAHAQQHHQQSPHPQSATSAGPPVPLTHQAAVSAAQRSYSQPDQRTGTPMQGGPGSFQAPGSREREQLNNPKLPIPRSLNVTQPVPVGMGQARPTMSGPANGAPGSMGQPVINKFPPFQLEGEGDRVLSKRKLDELVRQVTGGAEDALTPEVEETMLALADEFVDNVIGSACKLAKLRESPQLEIRDLQLILERNYNIRIPGYASDEVRTVRKVVPAPGWTQKMNAVQAAKVMNSGKTDI